MENNIFRDIQTQLDLNGPVLSWQQEPAISEISFDVSPALADGSTSFTLSGATSDFDSFSSSTIYTLTAKGTFTSTITLRGAAGGGGNPPQLVGRGGAVKGTVKFIKNQNYKLVVGKQGAFVEDSINNGGIGMGGTSFGGNDTAGYPDHAGGAGGGYTGLFVASITQANALLIAGGGGGAPGATGGDGGGSANNGNGSDGTSFGSGNSGGSGGSQTAGGDAGVGDNLHVGDSGAALRGGSTSQSNPFWSGSGGGGGYYGGGSGAGVDISTANSGDADTGGGGGGGSSYYSTDTTKVTNASYLASNNTEGGKVSFSVGSGAAATIIGIASATFPTSPSDNTGTISYQWYEGTTPLADSTKYTGTATTTFTIFDLESPTDNGREFHLTADYLPSQYETGNAINEPLVSSSVEISTLPAIEIIAQPTSVDTVLDTNALITVNADLTDASYPDDLGYQWYLDGNAITDGTITQTVTTSTTVSGPVDLTYQTSEEYTTIAGDTGIEVTVCGGKGGDGGDDNNGAGGDGGQGRCGRFYFPDGAHTFNFLVGKAGNDGTSGNNSAFGAGGSSPIAAGGDGGGAGSSGWSGGGGGGGGASAVQESGSTIIIAAGGGGGGGGSHNRAGDSGRSIKPGVGLGFGRGTIPTVKTGTDGVTASGDGGGGGGGGGGSATSSYSPFGEGGGAGQDNQSNAGEGSGGSGAYDDTKITFNMDGWLNDGEGYINIKYNGTVSVPTTTTKTTTVSGTTTKTLTIKSDMVGVHTAQCKISSPTGTNSPVYTDVVNFTSLNAVNKSMIQVEAVGISNSATISSINLANGEYTFHAVGSDPSTDVLTQYISFYATERDLDVEMDLYGGKGQDYVAFSGFGYHGLGQLGGEGGYSRIRFTMKQNEEYVIVGLRTDAINSPFLYRQAELIAVVGEGGDGGTSFGGGRGGGVSVAGERGSANGGDPGSHYEAGSLMADGIFGSAYLSPVLYLGDSQIPADGTNSSGGRTISCTKGVYYAQQGIGACNDISGTTQFRLPDGTLVTNTGDITRGFKAGYNIMQTAGLSIAQGSVSGDGGNGAGGGGGGINGKGGGGGSGYTDGSVTIVDTQLGGSTSWSKCVLRIVT